MKFSLLGSTVTKTWWQTLLCGLGKCACIMLSKRVSLQADVLFFSLTESLRLVRELFWSSLNAGMTGTSQNYLNTYFVLFLRLSKNTQTPNRRKTKGIILRRQLPSRLKGFMGVFSGCKIWSIIEVFYQYATMSLFSIQEKFLWHKDDWISSKILWINKLMNAEARNWFLLIIMVYNYFGMMGEKKIPQVVPLKKKN